MNWNSLPREAVELQFSCMGDEGPHHIPYDQCDEVTMMPQRVAGSRHSDPCGRESGLLLVPNVKGL